MPPGGIRTNDLSKRAAADLRLRPRGYWDRPTSNSAEVKETVKVYLYCSPGPSPPVLGRSLPLHLLYVFQQFVGHVAQSV